jgi:hypothetical protein
LESIYKNKDNNLSLSLCTFVTTGIIISKENRRHDDATNRSIINILLFDYDSMYVSSNISSVDYDIDYSILFIEFYNINHAGKLFVVKFYISNDFSLYAFTAIYITAAHISTV